MSAGYKWARCGVLCKELAEVLEDLTAHVPMTGSLRKCLVPEIEGIKIIGEIADAEANEYADALEQKREAENVSQGQS